jgi:L,D-transpeptidase ErfK/SrfK
MSDAPGTLAAPAAGEPAPPRPRARIVLVGTGLGVAILLIGSLAIAWIGGYRYVPVADVARATTAELPKKQSLQRLERQIAALQPKDTYIVVDSAQNRLRLMRKGEVLREAVASAGTGAVLKDEKTGRTWVFETPRGVRTVLSRLRDPCWRRPDWDYVENGEPIPKNDADRIDCAALGDYALILGNGYMIHGTLYERSLGLSVTHGCVRLGAKDLEAVWKATRLGTKVYMY